MPIGRNIKEALNTQFVLSCRIVDWARQVGKSTSSRKIVKPERKYVSLDPLDV